MGGTERNHLAFTISMSVPVAPAAAQRYSHILECHRCLVGDPTLAHAILDRLVHNAYTLELKGTPSLPGSATTQTTSWRISTASRSTSRMPVIRGSNPTVTDSLAAIVPAPAAIGRPKATARRLVNASVSDN